MILFLIHAGLRRQLRIAYSSTLNTLLEQVGKIVIGTRSVSFFVFGFRFHSEKKGTDFFHNPDFIFVS
jgi:hypothetical protein